MIAKLLLAAFSAALGFLLLEIGLRVAGYEAIYDVYTKPSIFWEYDPSLGWVHTPSSEGVYVGPRPWPVEFSTSIRINSHGLRGPEIETLPPGGLRVLLQGDSMVAAFEVDYEDTFGALLEKGLRDELGVPVQVINAGVRAYGSDQSYLYFQQRGRDFRPDLVLHLHSKNDPRNNITIHRMRRPFAKAAFVLRDGELELEGTPVPAYPICTAYRMNAELQVQRISSVKTEWMCTFQMLLADRSALLTFLALRIVENRNLLSQLYALGSPNQSELVSRDSKTKEIGYETRLTYSILAAFSEAVRGENSRLLVMVRGQELDLEDLAGEGVEVLSISDAWEGVRLRDLMFRNDGHFNEKAHQMLADFLRPRVADILREQRSATHTSEASDPPRRR